jgi:PST family polysaccharide transporter
LASKRSIKDQVAASSVWVIIGRASATLTSFIVFAVLARFLEPRDFGLVAFAAVFVDLTRMIALAGLPQALVQRKDWDQDVSSTAFWINIGFALLLAAILGGGGGLILASTYDPSFIWVMPVLCSTLIIDAARAPHEAKLQREFLYRSLAQRTIFATIIGGVVGVTMAYLGFGMGALVASRVTSSVIQTTVIWSFVRWWPKFGIAKEHFRMLMGFGVHLAGADILQQVSLKTPDLLIGLFLGPSSVGSYRIGARATSMIAEGVIAPMTASALSAFSRVRENGSVAQAFCRITKTCALLSYPIYFGAAAVAQEFVLICFGAKWELSGSVMMMLAFAGGASTLNSFSVPALIAMGRTRLVLVQSMYALATNILIVLLTVKFGVVMVATGFAVRGYLVNPFILYLLKRGIGLDIGEAVRGIAPPFISAMIMAAVLLVAKFEFMMGLPPIERLVILVPCGVLVYVAALLILGRSYVREMRSELTPFVLKFRAKLAR